MAIERNERSENSDQIDAAARGLNRLHLNNTGLNPLESGSEKDIVKNGLRALADMPVDDYEHLVKQMRRENQK